MNVVMNATDDLTPDTGVWTETVFTGLKGAALLLLVVWTMTANSLVFVVLYKNPKLQTVPNFLVGNLAFSDLCLSSIVLPLSSLYAVSGTWLLGKTFCEIWVSADILCCTASIWNLSIVGLDRYWAITSPVEYMNKRNQRTAVYMIASVWALAAVVSLSPLLGWKQMAATGNFIVDNVTGEEHCVFLDLPSYTVYSATGSFFVPTLVMFFVYYKIYQAFARHRAKHNYRQKVGKVIRQHVENTILHHELPKLENENENEEEEEEEESENADDSSPRKATADQSGPTGQRLNGTIVEEDEVLREDDAGVLQPATAVSSTHVVFVGQNVSEKESSPRRRSDRTAKQSTEDSSRSATQTAAADSIIELQETRVVGGGGGGGRGVAAIATTHIRRLGRLGRRKADTQSTYEQVDGRNDAGNAADAANDGPRSRHHHSRRSTHRHRRQSHPLKKPTSISAAKERRGVKVLGIILGCFTVCWSPFFVMYVLVQFCRGQCYINPHVEMFITWLGYSNSSMNPIIYTVFNRDYQIALKKIFGFTKSNAAAGHHFRRSRRV